MKTLAWKKILCASVLLLWAAACEAAYRGGNYVGGEGGGGGEQNIYNGQYGKRAEQPLPPLTPISSFEFHQIGDTDLTVTLNGIALPVPDVTHFENNLTQIVMHGVSGARVSSEHRENMASMILDINTTQAGPDFVITITTDRPMQMRSVRGVAPSDLYTLRLVTTQQQQRLIEEPVKTMQPQTLKVPTGPFAVNIPITLDLREADLRDVLRMMGIQMKKNIIVHDSVPPTTVTMTLKNVPLSEVYNYLMKTYDIMYQEMGSDTIIIGTTGGISQISGNEETRSYHIAYATPTALAGLLTRLTHIPAENITVDERLRTIFVSASPAKLEEVAIALQKLDNPGQQVMLQARILEFGDGASKQIEQAINGVYDHWWFNYSGQGGVITGFTDDNRIGRNYIEPDTVFSPAVTDMVTPMQGVWREFDAAFRAIESTRKGKTLANPSVITIDGQEASIRLTEDYPYISDFDEAGNPSWSTEIVGPQLRMTPIVGREGIVTINLSIETGEVLEMITGSNGEQMPRTTTRSVETNVRVRDGEPFVVGGLFRENILNERWRIPILGSIPILGEIFTYRNKLRDKTQVVIIVIPYILDTPDGAIEYERVMINQ